MSEISSGLVAVAWVPDDAIAKLRSGEPKIVLTGVPMLKYEGVNTSGIVVLSDAEAIIAKQSAALKLAREALESCDVGDCSIDPMVMPSFDAVAVDEALAAIDALKGE